MQETFLNLSIKNDIEDFRHSIDHLDAAFMFLLAERVRTVLKIVLIKHRDNLPIAPSEKREHDMQRILNLAAQQKLRHEFVRLMFNRMRDEAINIAKHVEIDAVELEIDLGELRESIYHIDSTICCLLAERFHIVKRVGEYKKQKQIKPLARKRWQEVLETKSKMAKRLGVDISFVQDLLNMIHDEALHIESSITGH